MNPVKNDRPCGECTLCCRLLNITARTDGPGAFPFDKPAGQTCKHCDLGRGCRIFETAELPNLCRTYMCGWKVGRLPEWARPDKIGAIVSSQADLTQFPGHHVMAVEQDPDRDVTEQLLQLLERGADLGFTFIFRVGDRAQILGNNREAVEALLAREGAAR